MRFEGRRRSSATPNLTPLIDVVFLLLVFFMLTSHFVEERRLQVDLPRSSSGEPGAGKGPIVVTVAADGRLLVGDADVDRAGLDEALRSALEGREERRVRVRGDGASALADTVVVLDAARRAGASGVDIVAEAP